MSIKISTLKTADFKRLVSALVFLCALCAFAGTLFAQDINQVEVLAYYAQRISKGSDDQKRDALFELRNLKSAEASRTALPALRDSSEIVRATAAASVIYLSGEEAVNNLRPLLKDKSPLVRREAAYALGKAANPNAINLLAEILQTDKIPEVRTAAAVALGEIGEAAAIDSLVKILQKKPAEADDFLRRAAARSIGQIAKFMQTGRREVITPTSLLPEKYRITEKPRLTNLSEDFPGFRPSISVLIQVLQNPNESGDVRREAAFALGEIRDASALTALQLNLTNQDYYLAEICREAIAKINLRP